MEGYPIAQEGRAWGKGSRLEGNDSQRGEVPKRDGNSFQGWTESQGVGAGKLLGGRTGNKV